MAAEGSRKGLAGVVQEAILTFVAMVLTLLADFRAGRLAALPPVAAPDGGAARGEEAENSPCAASGPSAASGACSALFDCSPFSRDGETIGVSGREASPPLERATARQSGDDGANAAVVPAQRARGWGKPAFKERGKGRVQPPRFSAPSALRNDIPAAIYRSTANQAVRRDGGRRRGPFFQKCLYAQEGGRDDIVPA
jgi:hypothetical protein